MSGYASRSNGKLVGDGTGLYSEYLERHFDWQQLTDERKKQLKRISTLRKDRGIITIASALKKDAPNAFNYDDRLPIFDQIRNIKGEKLDIILETPGGSAEIVEDIVKYIRIRFSELAIIIPGYAKSAGTIFTMAGDEILMESSSALGPIDAQIVQEGKRYSAHAFLQGLDKIKTEVAEIGTLNKAYIPILQNISPGEIQSCENSLAFAQELVTDWLSRYKFKYWEKHSSTGKPVTPEEKIERAKSIATDLCNHAKWKTHGRSITIEDLKKMKIKIEDYSSNPELFDAISRYYILLMMSFDTTAIYKIYETPESQIYKFQNPQTSNPNIPKKDLEKAKIAIQCENCKKNFNIQAIFKRGIPIEEDSIPFPQDNILICDNCGNRMDLTELKRSLESQTKRKIL